MSQLSPYDIEVIQILSNLQTGFKLEPISFRSVRWDDRIVPTDECYLKRDTVVLSPYARALLPTELTPILASALVYHKLLKPRHPLRFFWKQLILYLFLLLVVPPALLLLNRKYGNSASEDVEAYFILALWITTLLTYGARYRRKLRLMADNYAAQTIGKEVFLASLEKLQRFDPERGRGPLLPDFFSGWPRVRDRIQNLSREKLG